jgi:hypothetical protein
LKSCVVWFHIWRYWCVYILYTVYDIDRCCGFDLKPNSRTGLPEMGR